VCTEDEMEVFIGTGGLVGIFAYILWALTHHSLHSLMKVAERSSGSFDTTGVDAAKTQLELIEFQ